MREQSTGERTAEQQRHRHHHADQPLESRPQQEREDQCDRHPGREGRDERVFAPDAPHGEEPDGDRRSDEEAEREYARVSVERITACQQVHPDAVCDGDDELRKGCV